MHERHPGPNKRVCVQFFFDLLWPREYDGRCNYYCRRMSMVVNGDLSATSAPPSWPRRRHRPVLPAPVTMCRPASRSTSLSDHCGRGPSGYRDELGRASSPRASAIATSITMLFGCRRADQQDPRIFSHKIIPPFFSCNKRSCPAETCHVR